VKPSEVRTGRHSWGIRGTALVEFALVLPIFAFLILAIADLGRYFFVQHTVQFATREGTRLALVGGTLAGDDGNRLDRTASIVKIIKDNASVAVDRSALVVSIFPVSGSYSDPEGWENQQNAGNPGDYMRVRTSCSYSFLTPFVGQFFPNGAVVRAEATYRNELF
jgi:hypothetical protein